MISLRRFYSKSTEKPLGEIFKKMNVENKRSFGPAVKKKKPKSRSKSQTNMEISSAKSTEPELASEMFWLLKNPSIRSSQTINENSFSSKQGEKRTSKLIENRDFSSKLVSTAATTIPFTNNGLKDLLKFPLIVKEEISELDGNEDSSALTKYPSVGKILQTTMSESSREALIKWKLQKLEELGEEGFKKLQEDHLRKGKVFHETIKEFLLNDGEPPQKEAEIYPLWQSVLPALEILEPKVEKAEIPVEHPYLKYRGVVDCVSNISSNLSVIEWKKSDKLKPTKDSTFDAPLQLCAYLGALSVDPRYKYLPKQGFIVVAYTSGQKAEIHRLDEMDLQKYWRNWLLRVHEFWIRTRDGTLPEPV